MRTLIMSINRVQHRLGGRRVFKKKKKPGRPWSMCAQIRLVHEMPPPARNGDEDYSDSGLVDEHR